MGKQERNSNQVRALLGQSNVGTNGPTNRWTKSLIEALCSRLKTETGKMKTLVRSLIFRNKLYNKPGARFPGEKQYRDRRTDRQTNQPTDQPTN
jgi:hypothetical protein